MPVARAQMLSIKADRMLDVCSGAIKSPAVVLINNGKIEAINPKRDC
jgi:imidazolonepropionase-like amidohydrolase